MRLEDLRVDPSQLERFTEQLREPPPPASREWDVPELRLGENVILRPGWKDGPRVTLEVEI